MIAGISILLGSALLWLIFKMHPVNEKIRDLRESIQKAEYLYQKEREKNTP
jgi:hypothetical protein